jgi:hypothetical protein
VAYGPAFTRGLSHTACGKRTVSCTIPNCSEAGVDATFPGARRLKWVIQRFSRWFPSLSNARWAGNTIDRSLEILRLLLLALAAAIVGVGGGVAVLWLGIPVAAAVVISLKGGERYVREDGERVSRWLGLVVSGLAYAALLTDAFPGSSGASVQFKSTSSGAPTVGSALLRIVRAIPMVLGVCLIGIGALLFWLIAACAARLLGYLSSTVESCPSLSFNAGASA